MLVCMCLYTHTHTYIHTHACMHVRTFHISKRPFELQLDTKQVSKVQNKRIAQVYNTEIVQIHCKLNKCKKLRCFKL